MFVLERKYRSNMTFVVRCAPVLKEWNFCCCKCNLRAAAIVLAWLGTVGNLTLVVTSIIYLSHPSLRPRYAYESKEFFASTLSTAIGGSVLDVLLLYGIHNKKPAYMLPYLVLDLIGLIIMTVVSFIITIVMCVYSLLAGFITFVILTLLVLLSCFFWVVLYSYYRQVEEEKNPTTAIVNYNYGLPNDQMQITYPEDEKALCPYNPSKTTPEIA